MSSPPPIEIHARMSLTVVAGDDHACGVLTFGDGTEVEFEGYLELIAAVERARDTALEPSPDDRRRIS